MVHDDRRTETNKIQSKKTEAVIEVPGNLYLRVISYEDSATDARQDMFENFRTNEWT